MSDSVILWTVANQASPSMGFSRQEYQSGLPFPSPGDLPDPGIEPRPPALQADALLSEPPEKPHLIKKRNQRAHLLTLCTLTNENSCETQWNSGHLQAQRRGLTRNWLWWCDIMITPFSLQSCEKISTSQATKSLVFCYHNPSRF